jgi:hypothetical protein
MVRMCLAIAMERSVRANGPSDCPLAGVRGYVPNLQGDCSYK